MATSPADGALREGVRIALFSGNYNYVKDGANQALNALVRHLEERVGACVRVYSPITSTPAFPPEGTLVPVPSIALPLRPEYRLALGLTHSIRTDLSNFDPEIVHLSAPDILGTQALRWAKGVGLPIVASLHTRFETYFNYYGLGFVRHMIERHLDRFYGASQFLLVPTAAMAAEMERSYGNRVRLWGRGVDTELFSPAKRRQEWRARHGIAEREVAFLFFGRLVLEKGVDVYASILCQLRELGYTVRPLIVGEGPARTRLERALPDAVFTGHLAGQELATAVASADILINPSITEAFGNVVLEAMASGLAIVAADVPSARNLIRHDETGLLVQPENVQSYCDAARALIKNRVVRSRVGRLARAVAMTHKWDDCLDDVVSVYAEALRLK